MPIHRTFIILIATTALAACGGTVSAEALRDEADWTNTPLDTRVTLSGKPVVFQVHLHSPLPDGSQPFSTRVVILEPDGSLSVGVVYRDEPLRPLTCALGEPAWPKACRSDESNRAELERELERYNTAPDPSELSPELQLPS
jgi:hypothetical protein